MFNPLSLLQDKTSVTVDVIHRLLADKEDVTILDVRSQEEYETGHIQGSILLPLPELRKVVEKIPEKKQLLYVYCRSGARSSTAVSLLKQMGYGNAHNISGGILKWIQMGYSLER